MIGNVLGRLRRRPRRWSGSRTTPGARGSAAACSRSAGSIAGAGNNGEDRTEGCRAERIVGTYVHGPLLPKNPWLADELIAARSAAATAAR